MHESIVQLLICCHSIKGGCKDNKFNATLSSIQRVRTGLMSIDICERSIYRHGLCRYLRIHWFQGETVASSWSPNDTIILCLRIWTNPRVTLKLLMIYDFSFPRLSRVYICELVQNAHNPSVGLQLVIQSPTTSFLMLLCFVEREKQIS